MGDAYDQTISHLYLMMGGRWEQRSEMTIRPHAQYQQIERLDARDGLGLRRRGTGRSQLMNQFPGILNGRLRNELIILLILSPRSLLHRAPIRSHLMNVGLR